MYQKTEIDISETRRILISSITSKDFLKQLVEFADPKLMEERYARSILEWCFKFYYEYNDAPNKNIQSIFESESKRLKDTDVACIEEVLTSISNEFVIDVNNEYLITQAEIYFNKLALEDLIKKVEKNIKSGNIVEGNTLVEMFRAKKRLTSDGVDMLDSDSAIEEAFDDDNNDVLFQLQGAIGEMLGPFYRGGLSCVMAPPKRGKSWSMLEMATYAMYNGQKVWYFTFEMTKKQMWRRIWQNWSNSPKHRSGDYEVPQFNEFNEIEIVKKHFHKSTMSEIFKKRLSMRKQLRLSAFKTYAKPKNTFKVSQLKRMIERSYSVNNILPDLVVLDYADIMSPEHTNKDRRFELDQIWGDLSAIAEEFNIGIITGTQTNKSTFNKDIEEGDSSEASSKMTHVDKAWAINQNTEDRDNKIVRYACLFNRHDENNSNNQVAVLQNLLCGKAMLGSRFVKDITNMGKKK